MLDHCISAHRDEGELLGPELTRNIPFTHVTAGFYGSDFPLRAIAVEQPSVFRSSVCHRQDISPRRLCTNGRSSLRSR